MVDCLNELVLSSTVDIEDTAVLCCTKERAPRSVHAPWCSIAPPCPQHSLAKLDDMDGEEMQYFGVDRKGATGPRSG